jgi:peptidoglycan-associated lipoprotein
MATDSALIKTIYFDFDQSVLGEEALTSLRAHARLLRENPDRSMIIEGHADERGSREYNLALGQSRAEVVRSFLLTQGVHARQIETVSYGEEKPESTAHSETGWSRNRRAFLSYSSEVAGTTPKLARQ